MSKEDLFEFFLIKAYRSRHNEYPNGAKTEILQT